MSKLWVLTLWLLWGSPSTTTTLAFVNFRQAFRHVSSTRPVPTGISGKKTCLLEQLQESNQESVSLDTTAAAVTWSTRDTLNNNNTIRSVAIFDFGRRPNETERFERIDDVIMGGISSSVLRQVPGETFARWSGVCRQDGGGFCGVRTLPFQEKLEVSYADGIYIKCRLSSDDEAHRRVWKVTTRTENSRGEQLYQAIFTIPNTTTTTTTTTTNTTFSEKVDWCTIQVPFNEFQLVRGARLVPNAEPLFHQSKSNANGIYQIGLVMSKFTIGQNMTAMDNFRDGYFELQIQEIGIYGKNSSFSIENTTPNDDDVAALATVTSLTKQEALAQRPWILKVLSPVSKLFFTEQSQRRKSVLRILTQQRGLSHFRAVGLFGIQWRARQIGYPRSIWRMLNILAADSLRIILGYLARFGLFVPIQYTVRTIRALTALLSKCFAIATPKQEPKNLSSGEK